MVRASGTVPTARLTIGSSLRGPVLALAAALALVVAFSAPAAAQEGAGGDPFETYRACRERTVEGGGDELDAAHRCVPDPDALRRCLGTGRVSSAEVDACVREQLVETRVEDPGAATTAPAPSTTTIPSSTLVPLPPGDGGGLPIDLPDGVAGDRGDGDGGGGGLGLPAVVAIAAAALVAGVALGRMLRRPAEPFPASSSPASIPAPVPFPADPEPTPANEPDAVRAAEERSALVAALIELAHEARSDAVRGQIVRHLAAVGVEPVVVSPGERFDPTVHRGIHAESAAAPDQADTISAMERPGWADRGRVLRPPEVVVRRWDGGPS